MRRIAAITSRIKTVAKYWRWVLLLLVVAPEVQAHRSSDAWLQLTVTNRSVTLQLDLALKDLEGVLGLDTSDDGKLTWADLRRREPDLNDYVTRRLTLTNASERLILVPEPLRLVNHEEVVCASLLFTTEAVAPLTQLTLTYRCLFDLDPQHRALINVQWSGARVADVTAPGTDQLLAAESFTGLLSPASPSVNLVAPSGRSGGGSEASRGLAQFFVEGVHHIWSGYDHLLFLAALLLPAVLRRSGADWQPVERFRDAWMVVLKVVTAFTLAHSLTLALAALGLARPPSRLIESAIAASVVYAAVRNLWPARPGPMDAPTRPPTTRRVITIPFAFGLIHGFGFANALGELGLTGTALAAPLVGFNLGVETGQLAAVAVFLPAAFALRRTSFYRRGVLPVGSGLIAVTATAWLVDRAFELRFMPF